MIGHFDLKLHITCRQLHLVQLDLYLQEVLLDLGNLDRQLVHLVHLVQVFQQVLVVLEVRVVRHLRVCLVLPDHLGLLGVLQGR